MTAPALPARPGTVLFDLDGTILDSSRPVHAAWTAALAAMELEPLPRDQLHQVIGPPMQLAAPAVLADRGRGTTADLDEFVRRFRTAIGELEVEQAVAYPGILAIVRALHRDGRRLGIVTSKPVQATRRVVPALGVMDLFVHLEGPDEAHPEPKAETMARAVAQLAIDVTDTVLVGDRRHDVEAATAHGLPTIGVTWGGFGTEDELHRAGAAAVVHTTAELSTLLGLTRER